ncbi:MAG: nicotinate-nicotinamide nucleotide adenylyltransferase [Phycisphaeraceae bacterium]|nr:MAG: nicotinate-nicotinamide nucleotide adenylyltransferase [Phycisphaeraceae bacterium]
MQNRKARAAPITPVILPRRVRTLLVFGGSFDPPHFYHTIGPLMTLVRLFGASGWVLYVPAACSPHKARGPVASEDHRVAMLRAALDIPAPRSIWTDEIDRARWERERGVRRPSYTIDTLRRLRSVLPEQVTLRLLIGSDQAAAFHRWKDPRAIIRLAEPLILAREPITTASAIYSTLDRDFWTRDERRAWCTRLAPNFPLDESSTVLRNAIPRAPANPERWERTPGLGGISTPVARYIIEHRLYGFGAASPAGTRRTKRPTAKAAERRSKP